MKAFLKYRKRRRTTVVGARQVVAICGQFPTGAGEIAEPAARTEGSHRERDFCGRGFAVPQDNVRQEAQRSCFLSLVRSIALLRSQ
jgi:hypothetical protein